MPDNLSCHNNINCLQAARLSGGCVLVHCSQGVSRSAALSIGYLMWKLGRPYQEVADLVKAIRGVTNPNIGFACQVRLASTMELL